MTYYNEHDPKAAAWLRELVANGIIPRGHIDTRSISDVRADDLRGFGSCHFFAGIGGWTYALRLAGWPDGRPVWTGSCPCQPFSAAGKQRGTADERHLWPEFARLIKECRPTTVFGEQVASKLGRQWLAGVRVDLEGMGYAVGGADLCAASVGAPHIRQRLYWVGNANCTRLVQHSRPIPVQKEQPSTQLRGDAGGLADAERDTRGARRIADESRQSDGAEGAGAHAEFGRRGDVGRLEHPTGDGRLGRADGDDGGRREQSLGHPGAWDRFDIIQCLDGKARRIESGSFPLAHGVPGRVGLLRGYGNAIVPQVAAEFVRAFCESVTT